ncbi:hypothetical protein MSAN_01529100 [Mycena sanguinolenta]|uniref:F-box domain-containing protein n=1 Tax=Mycena sanguinolenta TaxID=230812 RepID=A0A8H6Y738_9AGAR|nr:hypothetical protein MSAN_01529100 [Mycena sanguinolenta]
MSFEALGEDVLLEILFFCDVSTVLAVSAINRALRRIALSKQLWLSLVLDQKFRDALELPPPDRKKLECLSTEELIAVVENAVAGPGPLSDSAHDESFSVTETRVRIPLDVVEDGNHPEARLLPGARYLHRRGTTEQRLYIYDVWSARCVWERLVQPRIMYEVDLVPGSAIARLFLVQWGVHLDTFTLHVEEVDLTAGASHELFNFSLDSIPLSSIVFGMTPWAIVGDFLLSPVLYSPSLLVLIDWHASTFVSLDCSGLSSVRLIPGYILSMYRESPSPREHILAATAMEAFSDCWQPLTDDSAGLAAQIEAGFPSKLTIDSLHITTQERLEYSGRPSKSELVSVTPDPLCAGAYNIYVYGLHSSERPPRPATLMQRIGNRISSMAGTARRAEARPAQAVLCYQFTTAVSAAGEACSLRLVSARPISNRGQAHCPRAIIPLSQGNSINVVYRERKGPGADAV